MVTAEISSGKGFALLASAVISNQFPLADREIVKMRCQANAAYLKRLGRAANGTEVRYITYLSVISFGAKDKKLKCWKESRSKITCYITSKFEA